MSTKLETLKKLLSEAEAQKKLLPDSVKNIETWINAGFLPEWAINSLLELFLENNYEELNDRFFRFIAFGTGGMRSRTIGKIPAASELGKESEYGTPEHAAVGASYMNDFNVIRATLGLFNYCKKYSDENAYGTPRLVIAYDVRHFSKHFCEIAAGVWNKMGGEVYIFDGARSTPQLSFTVRHLRATAGIVITASHNPSHDNGYKVYFKDGAQAINPHAEAIVEEVSKVKWDAISDFLDADLNGVKIVSPEDEEAYVKSIEDNVIDKGVMSAYKPKIVYTAVHGTGAVMCPRVMRHFGLDPILVEAQMQMDPRFPTVKQPNPEYAETLAMALHKAEESGADCLVATDPDSDRMGVAVRDDSGNLVLLTGNMIGSLLVEYRATQMKKFGLITKPENCAIIKTFVTTPLQDRIAHSHGIKCINTLTGFKWIGGRLERYERILAKAVGKDCDFLPYRERAALLETHSTFFIFGGEESYGYLGTDSVRDKDANAAVAMFAEMLAWLKSQNKTATRFLDEIYMKCGYHYETLKSICREGAQGAAAIQKFLSILDKSPLETVDGIKVSSAINFAKDKIQDADACIVPKEKFFFYTLENGYSFAIRASGTEPKIKFYAFAREDAPNQSALEAAKVSAPKKLESMLADLEKKFDELSCS